MRLKDLVGSGDRIVLFTLPFLAVGLVVNVLRPAAFAIRGPRALLRTISAIVFVAGVVTWIWSAALIVRDARRGRLVTTGPFALVKHPLYTSVSLLVLPAFGVLLGSWLGAFIGIAMYAGSRRYAPREEKALSETFGVSWDEYCARVKVSWL